MALLTSLRAVARNPLTMMLWGLIVAALLVVGSLPLFFGLTVVMPMLGHATWHLYRSVVEPQAAPPPTLPEGKERRYAADFPAVLFPWARKGVADSRTGEKLCAVIPDTVIARRRRA